MTPKSQKTSEKLVGLEGFEPPTHGLGNRCSIRLSYRPSCVFNNLQTIFCPYLSSLAQKLTISLTGRFRVTSSILSIPLVGKRPKLGILLLTCGV
jgi:hypothetical protein